MIIKQFKYTQDNLGYLIGADDTAMAVDAGAIEDIIAFADKNGMTIRYVTNTHSHHDHTLGNEQMLKLTGAEFIDCRQIQKDTWIDLGSQKIMAIQTPGHTLDSIAFITDDFMVTGDTLFNGTVGNCFSGDLEAFYHSLKRLISFPAATKVFAGHDYVIESMEIAKKIEPDNGFIDRYLKRYDPGLVVSTLEDELSVNPYIRFNDPAMINNLEERNMPTNTEIDRFKSIMELY